MEFSHSLADARNLSRRYSLLQTQAERLPAWIPVQRAAM